MRDLSTNQHKAVELQQKFRDLFDYIILINTGQKHKCWIGVVNCKGKFDVRMMPPSILRKHLDSHLWIDLNFSAVKNHCAKFL